MKRFGIFSVGCLVVLGAATHALAQGPSAPPPTCEQQLNGEMGAKGGVISQLGGVIQQVAGLREQLAAMTKERDEAKAALAKASELPKK